MTSSTPGAPRLTARFEEALAYASHVHAGQVRKGTDGIPYIGHLLGVAALVIDDGGDEDEGIGALLHDAAEDQGGRERLEDIRARFGEAVARIVDGCTDTYEKPKPAWRPRKERYLARLSDEPAAVLRVSCADKLHNARAILADYRSDGEGVWKRFNARRDDILWYYRRLVDVFRERGPARLSGELGRVVADLHAHAGRPDGTGPPWRSHEQAGGIVLFGEGVLLRKTASAHWIFPKGHVEAAETLEQAAEREVVEETGVRVAAGPFVGTVGYTVGDDHYTVHLFALAPRGMTPSWPEHQDADAFLVKAEDARGLLSFDEYRWALDRARAGPQPVAGAWVSRGRP